MPQTQWYWHNRLWTHEALMDYAREYPPDFPYTPQMLHDMYKPTERNYISPTMLQNCPRAETLKRWIPYTEYPDHAWIRQFGTYIHKIMEDHKHNEPDALLEVHLEVDLTFPDGRTTPFAGTADKVLPSRSLLIDYKTVPEPITGKDDKERGKIAGWTAQLSAYRWMLQLHDIWVDHAIIQQISKTTPHKLPIKLWGVAQAEDYVFNRAERFLSVFDGTYNLDNLPPVLDPELDAEMIWLCNSSWCPVKYACRQYAAQGK